MKANTMGASDHDPICRRLQGRIDFLLRFGKVKDPELMQSALECLSDLADASLDLLNNPSGSEAEHRAKCIRIRAAISRATGAKA